MSIKIFLTVLFSFVTPEVYAEIGVFSKVKSWFQGNKKPSDTKADTNTIKSYKKVDTNSMIEELLKNADDQKAQDLCQKYPQVVACQKRMEGTNKFRQIQFRAALFNNPKDKKDFDRYTLYKETEQSVKNLVLQGTKTSEICESLHLEEVLKNFTSNISCEDYVEDLKKALLSFPQKKR